MKRIRNPRYAPELLERRLSPSVTLPTVQVQVYVAPIDKPTDPPNDPMPDAPAGPVGPA